MEPFSRSQILIKSSGVNHLLSKKVIVFGLGGVGSYAVEALVRSGIGLIAIVDYDTFSISNLNRQIGATYQTIGQSKAMVTYQRIKEINPNCKVEVYDQLLTTDNIEQFQLTNYDYIVDAIDMVTSKVSLIAYAINHNLKIISALGTGNKLNPSQLVITDLSKTHTCPLAKIVRKLLKDHGIIHHQVVFSPELIKPITPNQSTPKQVPGSMIFVPATAGLLMASHIITTFINEVKDEEDR